MSCSRSHWRRCRQGATEANQDHVVALSPAGKFGDSAADLDHGVVVRLRIVRQHDRKGRLCFDRRA